MFRLSKLLCIMTFIFIAKTTQVFTMDDETKRRFVSRYRNLHDIFKDNTEWKNYKKVEGESFKEVIFQYYLTDQPKPELIKKLEGANDKLSSDERFFLQGVGQVFNLVCSIRNSKHIPELRRIAEFDRLLSSDQTKRSDLRKIANEVYGYYWKCEEDNLQIDNQSLDPKERRALDHVFSNKQEPSREQSEFLAKTQIAKINDQMEIIKKQMSELNDKELKNLLKKLENVQNLLPKHESSTHRK